MSIKKEKTKLKNDKSLNVIYLVGEPYDYYKIYFVNPDYENCLKIELKANRGLELMNTKSVINNRGNLTTQTTPSEAHELLYYCSYEKNGKRLPLPDDEMFELALELLRKRIKGKK